MQNVILALVYPVVLVSLWGGFTVGAGSVLTPEDRPAIQRAPERPVERRPSHPCFFIGRPFARDDKACQAFGGVRLVRWETECQPDPSCTKFPDGTDYAKP